ncbi:MAG: hypothetical protein AAF192_08665 [Pseudomonadota bacterium]
MLTKIVYSVHEYACEVHGCSGDVERVCGVLDQGDTDAGVPPAQEGQTFRASMETYGWVACRPDADGMLRVPQAPPGEIIGVAWNEGMGVAPDCFAGTREDVEVILNGEDGIGGWRGDDVEWLVVRISGAEGQLTFTRQPLPMIEFQFDKTKP